MIHSEMSIPEILVAHPETLQVFERFGISPTGYRAIEYENLFATSRVHQIELENLLAQLNAVAG